MIGYQIKTLRKKKKLTQKELADGIMHRCVLIRVEKGIAIPSFVQLQQLSEKLGVSIDYFTEVDASDEIDLPRSFIPHNNLSADVPHPNSQKIIHSFSTGNKQEFKKKHGLLYSYILGIAYWNVKDFATSLRFLKLFISRVEHTSKEIKSKYIIEYSESLNIVARINFFSKKYEQVESYLTKSLRALENHGRQNHVLFWFVSLNLSNYYEEIKNYTQALSSISTIINSENLLIHKSVTPAAHQTASVIYMNLGEMEKAKEHLNKAIHLYQYSNDFQQSGLCVINLLIIMRYEKKFSDALSLIENTLSTISSTEQIYHILSLHRVFILFNSRDFLKIPLELKKINFGKLRAKDRNSYLFLSGIMCFINGEYEKSKKHLQKAKPFFDENNIALDLFFITHLMNRMTSDKTVFTCNTSGPPLSPHVNLILSEQELHQLQSISIFSSK